MIEVEVRSFISEEKYNELIEYFKIKANFISEEKQVTTYYDCEQDFRLMETDKNYLRLWLKKGKMHDDSREEVEVILDNSQKDPLKKMLLELGYKEKIKWYRIRNNFADTTNNITITIDFSAGYGYIIEVEKIVEKDADVAKAKEDINNMFNELNINISSKEEFNNKFNDYKENWAIYTKNIKKFI